MNQSEKRELSVLTGLSLLATFYCGRKTYLASKECERKKRIFESLITEPTETELNEAPLNVEFPLIWPLENRDATNKIVKVLCDDAGQGFNPSWLLRMPKKVNSVELVHMGNPAQTFDLPKHVILRAWKTGYGKTSSLVSKGAYFSLQGATNAHINSEDADKLCWGLLTGISAGSTLTGALLLLSNL
jgi:hypothetical protein